MYDRTHRGIDRRSCVVLSVTMTGTLTGGSRAVPKDQIRTTSHLLALVEDIVERVGAVSALPWSMTDAAALHSQLAGVLGGFLFLSVTLLVGRRDATQGSQEAPHLTEALYLLSTSFVVLLVASFMFGVVSGYSDAALGLSLGSVAAVLLAIGAVATIAALALVVKHNHGAIEVQRHIEGLALLVYIVAFTHLTLTASDSVQGRSLAPLHWVFYIGIGFGWIVVTLALSAKRSECIRGLVSRWASKLPSPLSRGAKTSSGAMVVAIAIVVGLYIGISNTSTRVDWQIIAANLLGLAVFHVTSISILSSMPRETEL